MVALIASLSMNKIEIEGYLLQLQKTLLERAHLY